jgi:hypothetical protein
MSAFAGSSAAFDGLTIQADAASAGSGSSVAGYAAVNSVGRIYPTARPLLRFRIFGTSDVGFRGDGVAIAFKIQGSNDDGVTRVDLYVGVTPAGAGAALDISSGIVGGNFTSFFVNLSGNGLGNWTRIAEAEFYGPDPVAVPAVILAPYNGFLTNAAAAPCQSATGSITCPPNQCTYLGAVRIGPNAGQAIAHFSYGPAREFDVWNFYNQTEIVLNAGLLASSAPCDALHPTCYIPGGSLVYPTPVWQVQNNNMGASLTVFTGVAQQPIVVKRNQNAWLEAPAGGSAQFTIAIGWNTTATWCGTWGQWDIEGLSILSRGGYSQSARCQIPPTAGAQTFYALDAVGAGVVRAWIGERDSTLTGKYRG